MNKIWNGIKKHKWIVGIVILVVVIVFLGQKLLNSGSTTSSDQTVTDTVKKGNLTSSVSASGTVETANYLAVTTSVNGIVSKVYVKEGDKVIKGQKIMDVTLDADGEQSRSSSLAAYMQAQNSVAGAKSQLYSLDSALTQKKDAFKNVQETTNFESHAGRVAFQVAQDDYNAAKASYDQQQSKISQTEVSLNNSWLQYQAQSPTILAPSDGVIANVTAVEGSKISNSVTSDRSVVTVASIKKEGTPIISVNISELDINKVAVGQKVNVTLSSISDQTFTGTVAGIDKIGTTQSGVSNYPVIIKLESDSTKVLPNMSAQADIIISGKENVLYVPSASIQANNGKSYVTVVEANGSSKQVEVQAGISDDSNTEIVSGLNEGDVVLENTLPTSGFTTTTSTTGNRGGGGGFRLFGF